jgi:Spy/CpxP family protein refolding chaperone
MGIYIRGGQAAEGPGGHKPPASPNLPHHAAMHHGDVLDHNTRGAADQILYSKQQDDKIKRMQNFQRFDVIPT